LKNISNPAQIDSVVSAIRAACEGDANAGARAVLEHCMRVRLSDVMSNNTNGNDDADDVSVGAVLNVAMRCAESGLVVTGETVVLLIQDMLEAVDISRAARLFALVEAHAGALATALGEQPRALLMLLRMCIELMRRMSKSEHTVFCGRVLLFLAQVYPLTDRSGLNAKGDINAANITLFDDEQAFNDATTTPTANASTASDVVAESHDLRPIDYQFYKTFWSLQSQLRDPISVLASAEAWRSFETALDSVLAALSTQRVTVAGGDAARDDDADSFVKYLTSSSLLDLQLSDASFRRHVLLQMLIAFQTLLDYKPSTDQSQQQQQQQQQQTLSSTQASHVAAFKKHALSLLRDTPPHGEAFEAAVSRLLKREGGWTAWKAGGCPSFARERETLKRKPARAAAGGVAKRGAVSAAGDGNSVKLATASSNDQAMRAGRLPPTFDELVQPLRNDLIEFEDDVDFTTDHVFAWRLLRGAATSKLGLLSRFVGVTKASEVFKILDDDQKSREKRAAEQLQQPDKQQADDEKAAAADEEGLETDDAATAAAAAAAAATAAAAAAEPTEPDVDMVEAEREREPGEEARDAGRESGEADAEPEPEPENEPEQHEPIEESPPEVADSAAGEDDIEQQAAQDAEMSAAPVDSATAAALDDEIGAL
jgi:THO complex subunit 1